jgi:hypothetical protein
LLTAGHRESHGFVGGGCSYLLCSQSRALGLFPSDLGGDLDLAANTLGRLFGLHACGFGRGFPRRSYRGLGVVDSLLGGCLEALLHLLRRAHRLLTADGDLVSDRVRPLHGFLNSGHRSRARILSRGFGGVSRSLSGTLRLIASGLCRTLGVGTGDLCGVLDLDPRCLCNTARFVGCSLSGCFSRMLDGEFGCLLVLLGGGL